MLYTVWKNLRPAKKNYNYENKWEKHCTVTLKEYKVVTI